MVQVEKNHFSEMKEDVGMPHHENEVEQDTIFTRETTDTTDVPWTLQTKWKRNLQYYTNAESVYFVKP